MHVQIVQDVIDGNLGQTEAAKGNSWWQVAALTAATIINIVHPDSYADRNPVLVNFTTQTVLSARWHYTHMDHDLFTV